MSRLSAGNVSKHPPFSIKTFMIVCRHEKLKGCYSTMLVVYHVHIVFAAKNEIETASICSLFQHFAEIVLIWNILLVDISKIRNDSVLVSSNNLTKFSFSNRYPFMIWFLVLHFFAASDGMFIAAMFMTKRGLQWPWYVNC